MRLRLAVLDFARRFTETRMSETVLVTAPTTSSTDHITLATVTPTGATLYNGEAEIVYRSDLITPVEVASRLATVQKPMLRKPVGPLLEDGARVEVTASTTDASLVARVFTIEGAPDSGTVTAHRYRLVEVIA